ncbi:MAG TPA: hydantoinase/oxoprolinase family protein [Acidimicrobiia bacterium]
MSLGIDVGGTFTDVVSWDGSQLHLAKTSSTPRDQSVGVAEGCRLVAGDGAAAMLMHGTTVATNALLERAGCRVMLVTDAGFEDLVEIGRQARPSLYDPNRDRADALVPAHRRVGVDGDFDLENFDISADTEAVAIGFLGSYSDPAREREVAEHLRDRHPGVPILISYEVSGEFREFERINTTILSAYLGPRVESYLGRLTERVVPSYADRVLVMRSSGGLVPPADAARNAASILLSGPAGGVVAAAEVGKALGHTRVISFDMGGTSTDVCRIEHGVPEIGFERTLDGQVCRMPSIAVHTVGAGGGSVGWIDPGGALRVGPRSAGAVPGPACYDRGGTEPTVTDANVALGRIDWRAGLAGSLQLRPDLARAAVASLGERLGLDGVATALGMVRVVEAAMERAIRTVSVEEGADPREAALVAFGGAGGLHAVGLARSLDMRSVIVPPAAGVFSALGLLLSRPRWDRARSLLLREEEADRLGPEMQRLIDQTLEEYRAAIGPNVSEVVSQVDVRYLGQSHETTVSFAPGEGWGTLTERFHRAHRDRNGFARPGTPIEAVTLRVAALGDAAIGWSDLPEVRPSGPAEPEVVAVFTDSGEVEAAAIERSTLGTGDRFSGPAVVREPEATTWVPPGCSASVHATGAIEVTW